MAAKSRKIVKRSSVKQSSKKPAKTRLTREIAEMRKGLNKVLAKRSAKQFAKRSTAVAKTRKPAITAKKSVKTRSSLSTKERAIKRQVAENVHNAISKQFQVMLTSEEFIIRLTPENYKDVQAMLINDKSLTYCLIALMRKLYPKDFDDATPTINDESSTAGV